MHGMQEVTSSNLVFSTKDNQGVINEYSSLIYLYSNTICTQRSVISPHQVKRLPTYPIQ